MITLTLIKNNRSNWETSVNYLDINDFWFRFFFLGTYTWPHVAIYCTFTLIT